MPDLSNEPVEACQTFLETLQNMGVLVGDFYLLLGRAWTVSERTTPRVARKDQRCYQNAFDLACLEGGTYCEGFACPRGLIPVHHAWCVNELGHVLDPTWDSRGATYYGVALNRKFVISLLQETRRWGILAERLPLQALQSPIEEVFDTRWPLPLENQQLWSAKLAKAGVAARLPAKVSSTRRKAG